jgi:hypothetical protein
MSIIQGISSNPPTKNKLTSTINRPLITNTTVGGEMPSGSAFFEILYKFFTLIDRLIAPDERK